MLATVEEDKHAVKLSANDIVEGVWLSGLCPDVLYFSLHSPLLPFLFFLAVGAFFPLSLQTVPSSLLPPVCCFLLFFITARQAMETKFM